MLVLGTCPESWVLGALCVMRYALCVEEAYGRSPVSPLHDERGTYKGPTLAADHLANRSDEPFQAFSLACWLMSLRGGSGLFQHAEAFLLSTRPPEDARVMREHRGPVLCLATFSDLCG